MPACPRCGSDLSISNPLGPSCRQELCPLCGYEGGTVSSIIPGNYDTKEIQTAEMRKAESPGTEVAPSATDESRKGRVDANAVMALHQRTGLPVMECKTALVEADCDPLLAIEVLIKRLEASTTRCTFASPEFWEQFPARPDAKDAETKRQTQAKNAQQSVEG